MRTRDTLLMLFLGMQGKNSPFEHTGTGFLINSKWINCIFIIDVFFFLILFLLPFAFISLNASLANLLDHHRHDTLSKNCFKKRAVLIGGISPAKISTYIQIGVFFLFFFLSLADNWVLTFEFGSCEWKITVFIFGIILHMFLFISLTRSHCVVWRCFNNLSPNKML